MRLPVLMVILCYLVLLLTDWLVISDFRTMSLYSRFKPLPGSKKRSVWWKVYTVFAILVLALLTVAVCFPRRNVSADVTPVMWMLYVVLTVLFSQLVYSLFSLIGRLPVLFGARRCNTGLWVGLPLGVLVFSMMWWGALIGRNRIQSVEVSVSSPRLPAAFDGYRIAQISDLHVGTWGSDTVFLSRLVERVNALHPDIIVFTGDLVNRKASEVKPFISVLSRLSAPDGVLSVLGNHDYGDYVSWESPEAKVANLDSLRLFQKRMGWRLLDNASAYVRNQKGDSIVFIGVGNWGEPPFSRYGDLRKAYPSSAGSRPDSALNDSNFKILLSHNPEHWNREVSRVSNIDLTLAGHTHAMQIVFGLGSWRWSPASWKYSRWGGLYSLPGASGEPLNLYVNIGAGEVGIPMRIGADPEITLFTLHRSR